MLLMSNRTGNFSNSISNQIPRFFFFLFQIILKRYITNVNEFCSSTAAILTSSCILCLVTTKQINLVLPFTLSFTRNAKQETQTEFLSNSSISFYSLSLLIWLQFHRQNLLQIITQQLTFQIYTMHATKLLDQFLTLLLWSW